MARRKKARPAPDAETRVPIATRLPMKIVTALDKRARTVGLTRTAYMEQIIRKDLRKAAVDLEGSSSSIALSAGAETVFG